MKCKLMDKILNNEFVFDAMGADMFIKEWNHLMMEYGFISLADVFDDQLLLGQFEGSRMSNKFMYHFYGWKATLMSVVSAFEIRKGYRNYEYVLKLPKIKSLSEEDP